jgi:hypothetical protein
MSELMQILDQALSGHTVDQISSQLGVDRDSAQNAIGLAVPVLLGALSRNASTPEGARALENAVERDHDGSILDNLGGLLGGGGGGLLGGGGGGGLLGQVLGGVLGGGGGQEPAQGGGGLLGGGIGEAILRHVLGGRQASVEQGVGRATGLDAGSVAQLLAILAPIVMGALGRARQSGGGGLDSILGGAQQQVQQQAPGANDFLSGVLDANRDGSSLDDIARMGAGLLGGLFGGKKN